MAEDAPAAEPAGEEEESNTPEGHAAVKLDESLALAAAQHRSAVRVTSKQRVRILGVPLPIGGVSWVTSILVHAALIWAGVALYKHLVRPPKLELALGDGGANAVGVMWREQTPGGTGMPQIPDLDAPRTPSADSMAAVMNKLETQEQTDPTMSATASSYVGPKLLWGPPPPVGPSRGSSDLAGSPMVRRSNHPASSGAKSPPAQQGGGTGHGKSIGAGNGQLNGGQAGVPSGTPDPTLPAPVYPEESRRRGEEGTVKLSCSVRSDGSVGQIQVLSAPPYPRLTRSAIDAMSQAHFDRAYAGMSVVKAFNFVLH